MNLLVNWKTTFIGVCSVFAVAANVVQNGAIHAEDITALMTAIGLIFAKDFNVTGVR